MGFLVPDDEQHRALQQEAVGVSGLAQPEQQALDPVAEQQQVEIVTASRGLVLQTRLHGGREIFWGCAHVSISR